MDLILLTQFVYFAIVFIRSAFRPTDYKDMDDMAVYYTHQVIAAAYVTAAISKEIGSRGGWFFQLQYVLGIRVPFFSVSFAPAVLCALRRMCTYQTHVHTYTHNAPLFVLLSLAHARALTPLSHTLANDLSYSTLKHTCFRTAVALPAWPIPFP